MRGRMVAIVATMLIAALTPAAAQAAFPYKPADVGPTDYRNFRQPAGAPNDLQGKLDWMYAATKEPLNEPNNSDPRELFGVRGASLADKDPTADTAYRTTTGRPDVTIAVLDSGIKWNDAVAMTDIRKKTRLNAGELPVPERTRTTPTEPGQDCASFAADRSGFPPDDLNGDGVFNIVDFACDRRVTADPAKGVGPRFPKGSPNEGDPMLDPQDILIAFSDGKDDDGNAYVDDMVGWDFLDDDNDPYDDVQYGHGTGESRDSTAEADNGGELGSCPNCTVIHMRVGDSFIADVNRFAQAVTYAVDNDVLVVQEALGTLNNSTLATQAVNYAYDHGVTVIASAADEAAQHNNWPSSNPHVILVNSIKKYDEPQPNQAKHSYLSFNGCTNFNSKITLSIPSVSCSSDATGRAAGMAGMIYAAALNAREAGAGALGADHPTCKRVDGRPCAVSANEVRQLMATGTVGGTQQSDDVNFGLLNPITRQFTPEPSCTSARTPACTDPFGSIPGTDLRANGSIAPAPGSRSYPARAGHDQFYGYGRVNMNRAVKTTVAGTLPPEAEIDSPDWYELIDPSQPKVQIRGRVDARGGDYRCQLLVAPGSYPNNSSTEDPAPGDFKPLGSGHCDGQARTGPFSGPLGDVDLNDLRSRFPDNAGSFDGREPGTGVQTANGRPNVDAYGFVVKVVVTSRRTVGATPTTLTGEDRRNFRLHRDADMLAGFPRDLGGDGASSPLFVDLDGDNRNELLIGGSDGFVHAYRPDLSELPGWPVRMGALPLHTGARAYVSGQVSTDFGGAILGSIAAGDLDRDGTPEVVANDLEGRVMAWNTRGERVFSQESNLRFSGKPLEPFVNVRRGKTNRTQHGFIASPVLADLDRNDGGRLEVIAAALDRHVYAWNDDGSAVPGYPVLVVDRDNKVASIDAVTHAVRFDPARAGPELDQGAIIDTPAVGSIAGDEKPEIVVGTNEEYAADKGNEGPLNASPLNATALQIVPAAGVLDSGNSRLYAIKPEGDRDGDPGSGPQPYVDGWPFKVGMLGTETLPVVGEGVTGAPVIGEVNCGVNGGAGPKIGTTPHAGPGYIVNPDATSCYGKTPDGRDRSLRSDGGTGVDQEDNPVVPAFGHPAFGRLGDEAAAGLTFVAPALGIRRALDIALPEYQGGRDFLAAWNAATGEFRPGFPPSVNDLQFLTGPSIGDVDGRPGEEILSATASLDLQGFTAAGTPISDRWPKLTSDWTVANPLIGSFGVLETDAAARKTVFTVTRAGFMQAYRTDAPACSSSSWPRFHHDNANSGDERRDAVLPGAPSGFAVVGGKLTFRAPGDDLLCGSAARYELATSNRQITGGNFSDQEKIVPLDDSGQPLTPGDPGASQVLTLPAGFKRFVAVRAIDEVGSDGEANVGRTAVVTLRGPGALAGAETLPGGAAAPRPLRCLPRRVVLKTRRVGRIQIGHRRGRVLRLAGRPARRTRRSFRYCVRGGGGVFVSFAANGRSQLIVSTARRGGTRVGRGTPLRRLRRVYGKPRRVAPGLFKARRSGRIRFGVVRGRVRYVAVPSKRLAAHPRKLRRELRLLL